MTRRTVTHDDRHSTGSEIVHLERTGTLAGHPYHSVRRRSATDKTKHTVMRFPERDRGGKCVGAVKTTARGVSCKTAVLADPASGYRKEKTVSHIRFVEDGK